MRARCIGRKGWARSLLAVGMVLCPLIFLIGAWGQTNGSTKDILPLESVRLLARGTPGFGLTVFEGMEPERFEVELLEVVGGSILIQTSDPRLARLGGIASGMSGSPIFFDDPKTPDVKDDFKNAGAVAFAISGQREAPFIAVATPIEKMLKIGATEAASLLSQTISLRRPVVVGGKAYHRIMLAARPDAPRPENALVFSPIPIPLIFSGVRPQVISRLLGKGLDELARKGVFVFPAGRSDSAVPFEPGGVIAVNLITGDPITAGAIGTVTFLDDEKKLVYGFGHSFLSEGEVSFPMSSGVIHTLISSFGVPFKVGSPDETIQGAIVQDRSAGIVGLLDAEPPLAQVTTDIFLEGQTEPTRTTHQVAYTQQPNLFPFEETSFPVLVGLSIFLPAISLRDKVGAGSVRGSLEISLEGKEQKVIRDDLFSSTNDPFAEAFSSLVGNIFEPGLLDRLWFNEFEDAIPTDIKARLEVSDEVRRAKIQKLSAPRSVQRGKSLDVRVTLQPFRKKPMEQTFTLKVPPDFPPGPAVLFAVPGQAAQSALEELFPPPTNLDELIELLNEQPSPQTLAISLIPHLPPPGEPTFALDFFPTDFVLTGSAQTEVRIKNRSLAKKQRKSAT